MAITSQSKVQANQPTRITSFAELGQLMKLIDFAEPRGGRNRPKARVLKMYQHHRSLTYLWNRSLQTYRDGVEAASGPETIVECGPGARFSYLIPIPSLGGVCR